MYQLKDLIDIDRRFQNSVNLQMDIDDQKKIESYIPTRSSKLILDHYLENVNKRQEHATVLIGPYGKGKSHLLLVLLDKIHKMDKPFLPVIVSGTYEDLGQAFLMGMLDALKRVGREDILPNSYYSKAVKTIEGWKKEYPKAYEKYKKAIGNLGYTDEKFEDKLEKLDEKTLKVFKKIYSDITFGSEFNPIVELETTKIYEDINKKLCSNYGYQGIFIVFDEFSKYIEGHRMETFSRDMKILQDMCELANNSKEAQMHITFVAHKSIKEYGAALPREMINAYTGVEGRIKEVKFVVSAQNNYELIQHVIQKKSPDFVKEIKEIQPFYHNAIKSRELACFEALFQPKDFEKIIAQGCFPLMPITAYVLLLISEKVAQNERSIFTYLANDEKGSLYRMIQESGLQNRKIGVTADTVYDYFCNLFSEDTAQMGIHAEWLKADFALSKTADVMEQKVIKVMALFMIINKQEELPVATKYIACALNISEEDCQAVLSALIEKQIISYRPKTAAYVFKNNVGVDLEKEIRELVAKQPQNFNIPERIKAVSELDYVLPKRHNQEYTISRYFEYVFMNTNQLLNLPDGKTLFEEHFSDGKLIAVLSDEETDEAEIRSHYEQLNDRRLVLLLPEKKFSGEKTLRKLEAVKSLLSDKEFLENNQVLIQELQIYQEDLIYEINQLLQEIYLSDDETCHVYYEGMDHVHEFKNGKTFNSFLSDICDCVFEKTPKINNELINRQNISAQNKKARNKVLEKILNEEDCSLFEKGTSAEATLFRATLLQTGIRRKDRWIEDGCRQVLDEIDRFIQECDGRKICFENLYQRLLGTSYGARKGVIPIYLANQLAALQDTPVIYFDNREMVLDAGILENINDIPAEYYLFVEHETAQKEQYLSGLEEIFLSENMQNLRQSKGKRIKEIAEGMQRWYRALPQITLNFRKRPEPISEREMDHIYGFRKLFRQMELNPREILFEKMPEIFDQTDFLFLKEEIKKEKELMDQYLPKVQQSAINAIKAEFGAGEKENLKAVLTEWYLNQTKTAKTYLANNRVTNFMTYLAELNTYDETAIAGRISKIILDIYIEDWNDDSFETFEKELRNTRNEIEGIKEESEESGKKYIAFTNSQGNKVEKFYDAVEDDSTSYFLKNAIEDALDEFGDSLEMNQKVAVIMQALEKLIQK